MRYVNFALNDEQGLGILDNNVIYGYTESSEEYPGSLQQCIKDNRLDQHLAENLLKGDHFDPERITYRHY